MLFRIGKYYIISAVLMFCMGASALAQETLTLQKSIDYALANSLSVKSASEKMKVAEQKVKEARGAMMPSISGSGSYTYYGKLPEMEFDFSSMLSGMTGTKGAPPTGIGGSMQIPIGKEDTYLAGINIQQAVFTWGKIYNNYRQTKLSLEAAGQEFESIKQQVIFDTTKAFYDVLLTDKLVKVMEMALNQVQAHTKTAQDLVDAGMATNFDLLRAKVQLANTRSQLIKIQNALKLAKDSFKNTIGMSLDAQINLEGDFAYKPLELELDRLLESAMANRPEVKQLQLQEQVGKRIVSLAKAGNKPSIAAVYSYSYQSNADVLKDVFKRDNWRNSWSVTLALSVPVFDGLATRARVNQAKSGLRQIQIGKEQLMKGIGLEVHAAFLSFQESKELLTVQEETVQQAQESLRIANLRYKNGMITSIELMDAELAFTQAQTNYSNALHDYVIAIARLEKATASKL